MSIGHEEMAALAQCHAVAGKTDEARQVLGRCPPIESAAGNVARGISQVYAALGGTDRAFALLQRAYEAKAEVFGMMLVDPKWDPFRSALCRLPRESWTQQQRSAPIFPWRLLGYRIVILAFNTRIHP